MVKRMFLFQWIGSVWFVTVWSVCGLAMKNDQKDQSLSYSPPKAFAEEIGLSLVQAGDLVISEAGYWEHTTSDGDLVLLEEKKEEAKEGTKEEANSKDSILLSNPRKNQSLSYSPSNTFAEEMGLTRVQARKNKTQSLSDSPSNTFAEETGLTQFQAGDLVNSEAGYWESKSCKNKTLSPPKAFAEGKGLTQFQAKDLVISKKGCLESKSCKNKTLSPPKAFAEETGLTQFQAREWVFSEAGYWKHITSDIPSYLLTPQEGDLVLLDADYCLEKWADVIFQDLKGEDLLGWAFSTAENKKRFSMLPVEPTDDRLSGFMKLCRKNGAEILALSSLGYCNGSAKYDHICPGKTFLQRIKPLGYELEKFGLHVPEKNFTQFNADAPKYMFCHSIGYEGGVLFYNWDPGKQLNKFLETISWKPKRVFVLGARKEIEWYSDKLEIEWYSKRLESSLAFAFFMRNTPFCVVKCLKHWRSYEGHRLTLEEIERAKFQISFFKTTYAKDPENPIWLNDDKAKEFCAKLTPEEIECAKFRISLFKENYFGYLENPIWLGDEEAMEVFAKFNSFKKTHENLIGLNDKEAMEGFVKFNFFKKIHARDSENPIGPGDEEAMEVFAKFNSFKKTKFFKKTHENLIGLGDDEAMEVFVKFNSFKKTYARDLEVLAKFFKETHDFFKETHDEATEVFAKFNSFKKTHENLIGLGDDEAMEVFVKFNSFKETYAKDLEVLAKFFKETYAKDLEVLAKFNSFKETYKNWIELNDKEAMEVLAKFNSFKETYAKDLEVFAKFFKETYTEDPEVFAKFNSFKKTKFFKKTHENLIGLGDDEAMEVLAKFNSFKETYAEVLEKRFKETHAEEMENPIWLNDDLTTEVFAQDVQPTKSNQPKSSTEPNPE